MASSWDTIGQAASVMQVTGVDAFGLVNMIVQAAHTARRNRDLCQQLARHVLIVADLLRKLDIPALSKHLETRRPLEQLNAALFRAYKLVRSCTQQQENTSQLYQMFTGREVASKLRLAQEEIDRYINLIPMIGLVAAVGAPQATNEVHEDGSNDAAPTESRLPGNRLSLQQVAQSLTLEELQQQLQPQQAAWIWDSTKIVRISTKFAHFVNSSEMWLISDIILGSALQVATSPPRFSSYSSPPSRDDVLNLSVEDVVELTHGFAPTFMIGEGYFGKVYRATLQNGGVVAIKRLKKENFVSFRSEFSNEVALLESISHKNLVKLLGYIDKANERILITEYVSNGTLREHLEGQHGLALGFNQRLEIAIDVAKALSYLHTCAVEIIMHRDVKSSNILLTEGFVAKVADFGFARTGYTEPGIQTDVIGTEGYVDPVYLRTYHFTTKSDVFSYGILLLEILSGRRPIEARRDPSESITLRWAFNKYQSGNVRDILDPMLTEAVNEVILNKIFDLAFHCVARTREERPSMREVEDCLNWIRYKNAKDIAELTL